MRTSVAGCARVVLAARVALAVRVSQFPPELLLSRSRSPLASLSSLRNCSALAASVTQFAPELLRPRACRSLPATVVYVATVVVEVVSVLVAAVVVLVDAVVADVVILCQVSYVCVLRPCLWKLCLCLWML